MRRMLPLLGCTLAGLVVGAASTWILERALPRPGISSETAILTIRPPTFDHVPADGTAGIDDVWQRQINDHVFGLRNAVGAALSDLDVQRTEWHASFSDPDRRLRAMKRNAQVEPVPGTSLVLIHFDHASTADARTLANALARTYMNSAEREALAENYAKSKLLDDAIRKLFDDERTLELQSAQGDDPSKVEALQLELAGLRERRVQLQADLYEHGRRRKEGLCPIALVRPARDSSAMGGMTPGAFGTR